MASLIYENSSPTILENYEDISHSKPGCNTMIRRGQNRRIAEFPELTEQHVLDAFMDSGVTNNHVTQLGILLGLPQDTMHSLKAQSDSGPQIYAMKTVIKWLKRDPKNIGDNIQETFVELENQLRKVHLNCVIGKLRRKGKTQNVAPDLTALVGRMAENMKREESLEFGMKLGLNQADINDVIKEIGAGDHCRPPFIALAVYKEVERRHTFLNHSFVQKVTDALRTMNTSMLDEEKKDHLRGTIESIESDSMQCQPTLTANFVKILSQRYIQKSCATVKNEHVVTITAPEVIQETPNVNHVYTKTNIIKGSLATTAILILLISATLTPLSYWLISADITAIPITGHNETIIYELGDNSLWLESMDIQFVEEDHSCSVQLLTTECNDIAKSTIHSEELPLETLDYIYISERTTVSFKQSPELSTYYYPKYIWVFSGLTEAENNFADNFESLACSKPPEGAFCLKINDTESEMSTAHIAPTSSYYFIRCFNDVSCSFLSSISVVNKTVYEYEENNQSLSKIDSKTIKGHEKVNLRIQKNKLLPQTDSVCILMKLSDCNDNVYHIQDRGIKRSKAYLIFSCILFSTLIISSFTIFCIVRKIRNWGQHSSTERSNTV